MSKIDVYELVTNHILEEMDKGIVPWEKPWTGVSSGAYSGATGKPYSLLNQMILMIPGPYYTFHQVQELGGHVKRGEKAHMVVFWKLLQKKSEDEDEEKIEKIPVLRYYSVFHWNQCEGLPEPKKVTKENYPITEVEQLISRYCNCVGIKLYNSPSDEASYSPIADTISLPLMNQFHSTNLYYGTAFHELVHSTGHASRLARKTLMDNSKESYSREELVAELGSAMLLHHFNLETDATMRDHVSYLQNWSKLLRDDKKAIVVAAGAADKAARYILANTQKVLAVEPIGPNELLVMFEDGHAICDCSALEIDPDDFFTPQLKGTYVLFGERKIPIATILETKKG